MSNTQNYNLNSDKILEQIVTSKSYNKSFIPEVDGKKMLRELLPVKEAIAQGKGSELYQNVLLTYNRVMNDLIERQGEIIFQEDLTMPTKEIINNSNKPSLEYYDNKRERF